MKLIVAVVQDQDATRLLQKLVEKGIGATKMASTGGFLRQGNTTLFIGTPEERVAEVVGLVRETCHSRKAQVTPLTAVGRSISAFIPRPVEVPVGGAIVFVVDVEKFAKV